MATFTPFEGFVKVLRKLRRGITQEQVEAFAYEFLATEGKLPNKALTQVGIQMLLELSHYNVVHRVLYVKKAFAQRLINTAMEVPPRQIHMPYELFEVSFEDDFELIPGVQAPSCLVCLCPSEATLSMFYQYLLKATKYEEREINRIAGREVLKNSTCEIEEGLQDTLRIHFKPYEDPLGGMCHSAIHLKPNEGRSIDEVIQEMDTIRDRWSVSMEEREVETCKRLARIILGLQCYLSTDNPQVDDHKDHCRPRLGIPPTGLLFGRDFRAEPGWHLRKAHWRFLKHERYKRKEDGNIRSTWIKTMEVNKDAQPGAHKKEEEVPKGE